MTSTRKELMPSKRKAKAKRKNAGKPQPREKFSERNQQRFLTNLRKIRESRGMGQREVSEKLGKSGAYLGLMESGVFLPNLPMLLKMRQVYKLKNLAPFFAGLT